MLTERFWSKVEKTNSCWNWKAYIAQNGYGQFWLDGKDQYAHRISYTEFNHTFPLGLQIA